VSEGAQDYGTSSGVDRSVMKKIVLANQRSDLSFTTRDSYSRFLMQDSYYVRSALCIRNMSKQAAAAGCSHSGDTESVGFGSDVECDKPQRVWRLPLQDACFDTFNRAVCLDIQRTVSIKTQLAHYQMLKAILGRPRWKLCPRKHPGNQYDLEADLINYALAEYGDSSTKVL
jgi:hypothetical protein